jgi:hypothetical protein
MAGQTSIRLSSATRDALNALARERGLTADETVALGIKALREAEWRRRAEQEALEMAHDAAYQEVVRETQQYFGDDTAA